MINMCRLILHWISFFHELFILSVHTENSRNPIWTDKKNNSAFVCCFVTRAAVIKKYFQFVYPSAIGEKMLPGKKFPIKLFCAFGKIRKMLFRCAFTWHEKYLTTFLTPIYYSEISFVLCLGLWSLENPLRIFFFFSLFL